MKISLALLVLLGTLPTFAQEMTCLEKILTYSRYSGLHYLSRDEWSESADPLTVQSARAALNSLLGGKLLCDTNEYEVKGAPVCTTLMPDIPQSNVCYIYTNLGYFVVSKDNGKNVNFIFSRDNRFGTPSR